MSRCLLKFLFFISVFFTVQFPAYAKTNNILVLHSYHQGLEWTDNLTAGIKSVLDPMENEVYYEYLDTKRNTGARYEKNLAQLFQSKLKNISFDLVIVTDNNALSFIKKYGADLYPKAPIVFAGINNFNKSLIEGINEVTGVVESVALQETIELMLKTHPKTQKIIIIHDQTTTGKAVAQNMKSVTIQFKNRIDFEYYNDFLFEEVGSDLSKLSDDSLIYLLTFNRDKHNTFISYSDGIDLIKKRADVPIYGSWHFYVGKGIIGGVITSGFSQGKQAAELAVRILLGENANTIPVIKEGSNETVFDFDVMENFAIKKSQIPADSIVINEPLSLYEKLQHVPRWISISVTATILFLLLILIEQRRKQRAITRMNSTLDKLVKQKTAALNETSQKLNTLLNTLPSPVFYKDITNAYQMCNEAFSKTILGLPKDKILGKTVNELTNRIPQNQANMYNKKDIELIQNPGTQFYETKVDCCDGVTRDYMFHKATLHDASGRVSGIVGAMLDITERKKSEIYLKESEERFFHLQEASFEGIAIHNGGILLDANHRLSEMTGYSQDELMGMDGIKLFSNEYGGKVLDRILSDNHDLLEAIAIKKNGTTYPIEILSRKISYHGVMARVVVIRDVTAQKNAQEEREKLIGELERANTQLQSLATTDALTGLYNRGYISRKYTKEIKKCKRYGNELVIVMFDIDKFKLINDSKGHQFGDFVLQEISKIFEECIRESDWVGRYGGEEFLMIFPHTNLENGLLLANRIREAIEAMDWEFPEMKVTISGGIAQYNGESEMTLLNKADTLLYKAKSQGRNRINKE